MKRKGLLLVAALLALACSKDRTASLHFDDDVLLLFPGGDPDSSGSRSDAGRVMVDVRCAMVDGRCAMVDGQAGGDGQAMVDGQMLSDGQVTIDGESQKDLFVEPETTTIDAGDVSCFYVPAVGEFSPVLECYWDDPLENTGYNDVVMAPVVANLTDDNHDGVVDTKDIPDIAFITYRREEDGCCNSPGILRVVTGSCSSGITGMGGDEQLLHEHFYVKSPKLDNSSGLAIGDIDGDGKQDIVGMLVTSGTVAFSGVLYDAFPALTETTGAGSWGVLGAPHAVAALTDPAPDDSKFVFTSKADAELSFTWEWPYSSIALVTVKVRIHARSPGGMANLSATISSGGQKQTSTPQSLGIGNDFQELVFEFPKNPFNSQKQWTNGNLQALEFGFTHAGPEGVELQVTKIAVEVGHVEKKWDSTHPKGSNIVTAVQPAIADLEKDGAAEIVLGRVVLDGATGTKKWTGTGDVGINSFFGPISVAADVDLDGALEVIAGGTLYAADGSTKWKYQFGNEGTGCKSGGLPCDGFNAVGNFDQDDYGEIVIMREGVLYILEHTGDLKARIFLPGDDCNWNEGGPPTVADFDGDGQPEVGVAGADYYVVFDLDCCGDFPYCETPSPVNPQCASPGIRWQVPNFDCSSRVTGSSVFDFDGDGAAEVVYNDEKHFRIFRGTDGFILFEEPNTSHTRLEYAVIADCDNDANAEIVVVENGSGNAPTPLQVWGDAFDNWVPTRRIWNEHTYHITNITEDGLMPADGEVPNWFQYNNFRQNMPDYDPFLAPDLIADILPSNLDACPVQANLRAQVCNVGQLWVPPGVPVSFFAVDTQQPLPCLEASSTPVMLEPAECANVNCAIAQTPALPQSLAIRACVDDFVYACQGPGMKNECKEDNNSGEGIAQLCP